MRLLLPTGTATLETVNAAAKGMDADVVVTGEIASFLTPRQLKELLHGSGYDMAIVSGMCTASFEEVEEETGIPVYRGPRHAADLGFILPLVGTIPFSRTVPADDLLADQRREEAEKKVEETEAGAEPVYLIGSLKIGGTSRMKVLAEIMDAHREPDILGRVEEFFRKGADIVDLGFGFDATPGDVSRVFCELEDVPGPLAADTQDPVLIEAALDRADLVLSLTEMNIPLIGPSLADHGTGAVVIPGKRSLRENIRLAEEAGLSCIIADPLLQPAGSGLVK
ncbi:MAG: hypothetical protein HGA55_05965 [Methanoregulaceae archaeon]|nr:hypothetical protein [Methanoregulaceae archaeon]